MALTPNFRLDDAGSTDTWRSLDSILAKVANHIHNGEVASMESVVDPPTLTYDSDGGFIPAGTPLFYVVTLVDETGRESPPSSVATITTPPALARPGGAVLEYATTGGFLNPGAYVYALSAYVNGDTYAETLESDHRQIIVPGGTNTNVVTITFPDLPEGADGWNIYRLKPNGLILSYLVSVPMGGEDPPTSWDDTGFVVDDCNRRPSPENATGESGTILVEYPDSAVPEGYTWNIYRSPTPSEWENSLVHSVVEETSEGSGIIAVEHLDIGEGTLNFSPPPTGAATVPMPQKVDLNQHTTGNLPAERIEGLAGEWEASIVDLTSEVPGSIAVDLSSLDSDVSLVLLSTPSGADSVLNITLPDADGRGPLFIIGTGDGTDLVSLDAGSGAGPLKTAYQPGATLYLLPTLIPVGGEPVYLWASAPLIPSPAATDEPSTLVNSGPGEPVSWEAPGSWQTLVDASPTLPSYVDPDTSDDVTPLGLRFRTLPNDGVELKGSFSYKDAGGTVIEPTAGSVVASLFSQYLPEDPPVIHAVGYDSSDDSSHACYMTLNVDSGDLTLESVGGTLYTVHAEWRAVGA